MRSAAECFVVVGRSSGSCVSNAARSAQAPHRGDEYREDNAQRQGQEGRERRPAPRARLLIYGVERRRTRVVQQTEEHEVHRCEQIPAAGQQNVARLFVLLPSMSTPAVPPSACPKAMRVSIKMVGTTISLAGIAST